MSTILEPHVTETAVERLADMLCDANNDSVAINATMSIILGLGRADYGADVPRWQVRTARGVTRRYRKLSRFITDGMPWGLSSSVGVILAHAYSDSKLYAELVRLLGEDAEKAEKDLKAARTKVEIDAIPGPITPQEAAAKRWNPGRATHTSTKARSDVNSLRFRVADPNHPKHGQAKELLQKVERGEMSPTTARNRMDSDPVRHSLGQAKANLRKLDTVTRAEFLQWLIDQGAVLSLVPNPDFAGFTDGRKPKPSVG